MKNESNFEQMSLLFLENEDEEPEKEKVFAQSFGINHGGTDEWYTPREAVEVLLPYLEPGSKILCPFDTEESEYVKVFKDHGYEVEYSHISNGEDFFKLEKPNVDYVISNPPYSKRTAILKRLYEWGVPFALLLNGTDLFDSWERFELAKHGGGVEVLYIYPRVRFLDSIGNRNSPPFQSCYWCSGLLKKGLEFASMEEDISQITFWENLYE